MSPVPAGYDWALSTTGSKRHIWVDGTAICVPSLALGTERDTDWVMSYAACKRCLQRTGGQE